MEQTCYRAMMFACEVHATQRRKYTNTSYTVHLSEVAGIVATVAPLEMVDLMVSVAWLHDCMEDQAVTVELLREVFGDNVAEGVRLLSDLEEGNRAARKAMSRDRLANAPSWVQTIKCADIISNASSILIHDPNFGVVYLEEMRLLLDRLVDADKRLLAQARSLVSEAMCAAAMSDTTNTVKVSEGVPAVLGVRWLAGWYATRLHAVHKDAVPDGKDGAQAVCGKWVYAQPRTNRAARKIAAGLTRCKHCERQLLPSTLLARQASTDVGCWCESCDMAANAGIRTRMSVCPACGDKRCPRAQLHSNECMQDGGSRAGFLP